MLLPAFSRLFILLWRCHETNKETSRKRLWNFIFLHENENSLALFKLTLSLELFFLSLFFLFSSSLHQFLTFKRSYIKHTCSQTASSAANRVLNNTFLIKILHLKTAVGLSFCPIQRLLAHFRHHCNNVSAKIMNFHPKM